MSPTHPVLVTFFVIAVALSLVAVLGRVSVPIFGEIGTDDKLLRRLFAFMGFIMLCLSIFITSFPAGASWVLMEPTKAEMNIGGGTRCATHEVSSFDKCKKLCSADPDCEGWTYQPDWGGPDNITCFLYSEVVRMHKRKDTWSGYKRVFARPIH